MSTVLIYTSPARGHLYPMMDVAIELRDRGNRVVVQTLADERKRVLAAGLEHRPISPDIEALPVEDYRSGSPIAKLQSTLDTWNRRARHDAADLRASDAELAPDLLVVDANTWGAAAYAEAKGAPWAMYLPYVLPLPSAETPAFGPGFAPPRTWLDRTRDRLVWTVTGFALRGQLRRLTELRAELGVGPIVRLADLFLRADVLLYRTAEPFEYPRSSWPSSLRPIGPGLWAPPGEAPAWLADLPRPRVLVNVSTEFQDDGAIVETALEALADEPGSVIVTTSAVDPARFTPPHARVRIERFLPHAAVVPEVDAVVTHGGMGSTQRALAAGVPVCVVPWGRDQNETAKRVEVSGAGVVVPRAELSAAALREAVQETLRRKDAATRVAQGFRAAGGAARGADVLEALITDGEASTRAA